MQESRSAARHPEWKLLRGGASFLGGAVVELVLATIQGALAADLPIKFSPTLCAVMMAAWLFGPLAAAGAVAGGALAVNVVLLEPHFVVATGRNELLGTLSFVALALCAAVCVVVARRRFDASHSAQQRAMDLLREQSTRLLAIERRCADEAAIRAAEVERSRALGDDVARVERYAHALEARVVEAEELLRTVPIPLALVGDEEGLPVVKFASAEITGERGLEAAYSALSGLVADTGIPFGPSHHPLDAAMRGEPVLGRRAAWLHGGALRPVRLFARYHVARRTLAVAIVPDEPSRPEGLLH